MDCPSCHESLPEDAAFCGHCGQSLVSEQVCGGCGRSNPPEMRFCLGCGQALGEAAGPDAPRRNPRAYTPKHLADKILQSRSVLEGERKQVTVLFADVKGSMELSARIDPEEWHAILDRFFQILTDGVHRFEGTVNQYTGDGIMALFGAPIAHEDHAQRACWAALWLRDALREFGHELRRERGFDFLTRIGLNSGGVIVGKIGDDLRMDYTAQGSTVGLAERVQQLAEPGKPYLSEETAGLVRGYFRLEDLGEFQVKGVAAPVRAYGLEGAGELRTRLDVSRSRGFSRFVGRADEMATLELALHRATEGSGQVVGVVGEAGVGKSRLCLEFAERCRAQGITVHEAHCPSHGKTVPFLPLLELLRDLLGVSDRDAPLKVRETITGRCLVLDRALEDFLPLVFDFVGVVDPERRAPALDPDTRQRRLFAFVRRLVESLSAREPTLILVDDLHWIDAASDAFLAQIVEAVGGSRSMLLVNFRPEYRAEWTSRSYYLQLPLAPLGAAEIAELLNELLGLDESLVELRELIHERTAGNPFFIEEVEHALVEGGALEGSPGRYRLVTPVERIEVPATVQAVLAARIDRLSERERQVLQTAAVIGRRFGESTLKRVADLTGSDLSAALATLQAAEFVRQEALYPRSEYAFRHPLTEQVAYESQLGTRRARIHATVARALEEEQAEDPDEHAALLAHHWERAGEALQAARWHRRAAEWAGLRKPEEALRHWRSCGELVARLSASEEAAALRLASRDGILAGAMALFGITDEEAEAAFQEGQSLAEAAGDSTSLAGVLMHYGGVLATRGRYAEALPLAAEAIQVADRTGDRGLQSATRCLYLAEFATGQLEELRVRCEEGLDLVDGDPDLGSDYLGQSPLVALTINRGNVLVLQGRLREGFSVLDQGIELARQHDQLIWLGIGHVNSAMNWSYLGDLDRSMRNVRELAGLVEEVGVPAMHVMYGVALGTVQVAREEWQEAVRTLEPIRGIVPWIDGLLAEAHLGCGDHDRARAVVEEGLAHQRATGALYFELFELISRARVLRTIDAIGEIDAIEASLSRADELARETGARLTLPRIHEERARLAQALGQPEDAERDLHEAHRLYAQMGATGHAERLARELDEMRGQQSQQS